MSRASGSTIIAMLSIASFLTPFMGSSVNVALPAMGSELGMDAYSLGWVTLSFLLSAAAFLVPMGRLADIRGRKRVFMVGCAFYSMSSILSAISNSGPMLIAARTLQGIGASMLFGTGVAILTSFFPVGERGKAIGISTAATYIGLSLGPFVGGLLTGTIGWRSIFILNALLSAIITVASYLFIKEEWAEARGEKLDVVGSLLYASMLVMTIYGMSSPLGWQSIWLIVLGLITMLLFILWEGMVKAPVLNIRIFKENVVFSLSNLAALINYSATYAVAFLLNLYLQYIKGLTPQLAGTVLLVQPIMQAAVSPAAGKLSDRFDARLIASAGMLLTALGLFPLSYIGMNTDLQYIMASLTLLGIGFGLFSSPNTNVIMGSVESRLFGVASGVLGTMRLVGQVLSMSIATMSMNLFVGRVQITPERYAPFVSSVGLTFTLFTTVCLVGTAISLVGSESIRRLVRVCKHNRRI